jgi:hypothetical protein
MPVVFTNCSQRKRIAPEAPLRAATLHSGDVMSVAADWMERVSSAGVTQPAEDLYSGRNFTLSRTAANGTASSLYIVSAGLGLVRSSDRVPAYSLTVARSSADNVLAHLEQSAATAADWWDALGKAGGGKSIRRVVARLRPAPVLIALPASYIAMIAHDLAGLSDSDRLRLRIFTGSNKAHIPEDLRSAVMPYDDRLDGHDSPVPGTRSDFAARALWDFCTSVLSTSPDAAATRHAKMIKDRLATWRRPTSVARQRGTDEELVALIKDNWEVARGRTTVLLRILRDDLGIACEQGRLSRLAAAVRATVMS